MVALPVVLVNLTQAIDPEPPQFRVRDNPSIVALALRCLIYVKPKENNISLARPPSATGA